jgi:hypothetical protein
MKVVNAVGFLRRVLLADAVLSSGMALLLIAAASAIASITALPAGLLAGAGWALVPWVALVMFAATRDPLRALLVWAIVALNAVWAIESVALLFADSIEATVFGVFFVLSQAIVVAVLAALQAAGLRAMRRSAEA